MAPVRADTSKRLGALMLQGWAMLAENCPDCKVRCPSVCCFCVTTHARDLLLRCA